MSRTDFADAAAERAAVEELLAKLKVNALTVAARYTQQEVNDHLVTLERVKRAVELLEWVLSVQPPAPGGRVKVSL